MQRRITKAATITLIALVILPMLAVAASSKVKHVGVFTKPLPPTPTGWRQFVKSSYAETLNYSWADKDAYKRDMTLQVHFYQHAWNPAQHRPEFFKNMTFATAGKKQLAELEKKANDKPAYKPDAKVPYFTGNSTIGPWKMRTYVRRNTQSSKPLVCRQSGSALKLLMIDSCVDITRVPLRYT